MRPRQTSSALLGAALVVFPFLLACSDVGDATLDPYNPTPGRGTLQVVVSGTVVDAEGVAVSDATVLLTATHPDEPGSGLGACEGSVLADVDALPLEQRADGTFERLVQTTAAGVTTFTGCLVFDVRVGREAWRFSGIPAEFGVAGVSPDTVAVELSLD